MITYGIAMLFCGIPIFFQEVAIGQYLGAGGMSLVGQLCPLLQGNYFFISLDIEIIQGIRQQEIYNHKYIIGFQVWDMLR